MRKNVFASDMTFSLNQNLAVYFPLCLPQYEILYWSFFVSTLAVQNKEVIAKRFDYPTVVLFSGINEHENTADVKRIATEEDYCRVVETFGYYILVLNS